MFVVVVFFFSLLLTLLHSERPKLYTILAFLRAIGLIKLKSSKSVHFVIYLRYNKDYWQIHTGTDRKAGKFEEHYLSVSSVTFSVTNKIV